MNFTVGLALFFLGFMIGIFITANVAKSSLTKEFKTGYTIQDGELYRIINIKAPNLTVQQ
jgi:hypothetical protein